MNTYSVGSRGLRPAGLPGDNDLVDRQDGPHGLGGQLDGPLLADKQVENSLVLGVQRAGIVLVLDRQLERGLASEGS